MRISTLKDQLVVARLFASVAFAGTSVVRAVGAPVNANAPVATSCTAQPIISLAVDAPDEPIVPENHC